MAKNQEETVKKTTKVLIEFHGDSAVVHRGGGFPSIWDKTEKSVAWLKDKDYKPEEVEIVGDKPPCWDVIFSPPADPIIPVSDPANGASVQVELTIPIGDPADVPAVRVELTIPISNPTDVPAVQET